MSRVLTAAALPAYTPASARPAAAPARVRIHWTPVTVGLMIGMIVAVSRIHQHFGLIAKLRPALAALAVVVLWAFLVPSAMRWRNLWEFWPGRVVTALAAVACLSVAFGISMGNSGKFVLDVYSRSLLQAALIAVSIRRARDLYAIVWGYVTGAALLCFLSLFVFRTYSYGNVDRLASLYAYDANDAGLVLLVGLPLILLLFRTTRGATRVATVLILLGSAASIARTGSRGAFVGLAVVGLTMLFTLRRISFGHKMMFLALAGIALTLAAPRGYWTQMRTVLHPADDYNWSSEDGRKELALRGLGYMMEYPVVGIGIGNFPRAECTISVKARHHLRGTGLRCFAPHNSHVQVAAELGVTGAVLWVVLLGGGVIGMRRLGRRIPRHWEFGADEQRFLFHAPAALSLAMLGFAVSATFLTFAWLEIVYLIVAMIIGLYAAVRDARLRELAAFSLMHARRRAEAQSVDAALQIGTECSRDATRRSTRECDHATA